MCLRTDGQMDGGTHFNSLLRLMSGDNKIPLSKHAGISFKIPNTLSSHCWFSRAGSTDAWTTPEVTGRDSGAGAWGTGSWVWSGGVGASLDWAAAASERI